MKVDKKKPKRNLIDIEYLEIPFESEVFYKMRNYVYKKFYASPIENRYTKIRRKIIDNLDYQEYGKKKAVFSLSIYEFHNVLESNRALCADYDDSVMKSFKLEEANFLFHCKADFGIWEIKLFENIKYRKFKGVQYMIFKVDYAIIILMDSLHYLFQCYQYPNNKIWRFK